MAVRSYVFDSSTVPTRTPHTLRTLEALQCRRGATAAEFGLIASLISSLVLGVMEVGRYMLAEEAVQIVMADAVRLSTLRVSANLNADRNACEQVAAPLAASISRARVLNADRLSVTLDGCSTTAGRTTVTVVVIYTHYYSIPVLNSRSTVISASSLALIN